MASIYFPRDTRLNYTMVWIIQLCVAGCRAVAVRAALKYVDICMGMNRFGRWCRRLWLDRYHLLSQLQMYLMAFLLIKTELPPVEVLWAGVTTQQSTSYGKKAIRHTRDFTEPIRGFYATVEQPTGAALCRWTLSYEVDAVAIQIISRVDKQFKLSSVDIMNDRELITTVELPVVDDLSSVRLETLPGLWFEPTICRMESCFMD